MNIGDEKGFILERAIIDSNASNILELGVYLGYSTIRILKNLKNESKLTSIESNKKFANIALEHIKLAGLSERHELKIGKSNDVIPNLKEKYKYQIKAVTADAVVFSIVNKELNCILIRRGIEPFKGKLALPGGFLKRNESAESD